MPEFKHGDNLEIDRGGLFLKLKSKDDNIRFRLLDGGYYNVKHFIQDENDKWNITLCPRLMDAVKGEPEPECELCVQFFELIAQSKEAKLKGDTDLADRLKKQAKKYQNNTSFFYPIIDRDAEKFRVFQTTVGVRSEFEKQLKAGIDLAAFDFVVTREEEKGPGKYYSVVRMDSTVSEEFSETELIEVKKAESINLAETIEGNSSTMPMSPEQSKAYEEATGEMRAAEQQLKQDQDGAPPIDESNGKF